MAIVRQSWKSRGPLYTEYGVSIHCVRKDQTSSVSSMYHHLHPAVEHINKNCKSDQACFFIIYLIRIKLQYHTLLHVPMS